ncbi:MAG: sulfatase-like hydrolase/transferase, partial [Gemmatimonadetes bacterium]|nr:sulfatase-like hydrolase/transferase [Gemmatimonadota bacterium]
NTPFCYWWGPTNTHRSWERGSGKALWGLEPDDLKGRLPGFLPDVHDIREDVADSLGECQAVDAGLGVLIQRLEEIGELDNTLIVVSGDHGIPGFPRGKCNLYDIGCEVTLAARWPNNIPAGRTVEDFVNLMDLAPTFLEAAGADIPDTMTGKSLLPVLKSDQSGLVDPDRTFVITGRERHVGTAREGQLPYPQRAIRTADFLYIHNFAPDRWPMGDPQGLDDLHAEAPSAEDLTGKTFIAYPDMDASPTKSYMILHRAEQDVQELFEIGFGKRPQEELYDLRVDPHYMNNIAADPEYDPIRKELSTTLMQILREQSDPRLVESPCRFEHAPYAGPVED